MVGKFYERYVEAMTPFDPEKPVGNFDKGDDEHDMEEEAVTNGNPNVMAFQFPSWGMTDKYREEFRKHPSKFREPFIPGKAYTCSPDWDPDEVDDEGHPRHSEDDKIQISKMRGYEASNPETFKVERRGKFAEAEGLRGWCH
jgi:hypothetical protein